MIGHTLKWVEDPAPKPVRPSVWVPLADKHRMSICFQSKCVSTPSSNVPYIVEFWGVGFEARDVGACVVQVAEIMKRKKSNG